MFVREIVIYRYIFKDFSLRIRAGSKLALVGINGASKTTPVTLITRLYQPTGGKILINGIDIFGREEYLNLFSVA
ncbi:MAG: ATP-binding cassette domain-containing protein [Anaerocolumna sp.]